MPQNKYIGTKETARVFLNHPGKGSLQKAKELDKEIKGRFG